MVKLLVHVHRLNSLTHVDTKGGGTKDAFLDRSEISSQIPDSRELIV